MNYRSDEPRAPRPPAAATPASTPQPAVAPTQPYGAWQFVKNVWSAFSEHEDMQMAAALAYYAMFSLAPLLVIAVVVASLFYNPQDVQGEVQTQIREAIGPQAAEQINTMMTNVRQTESGLSATLLSLLAILFGATGVVAQLQVALNKAWGVEVSPESSGIMSFFWKRALSLLMILGIGFLLVVSLVAGTAVSVVGAWFSHLLPAGFSGPLLIGLNYLVSFAIITALFAAIFRFLPDAHLDWRDVFIGAAVTALLFIVGNFLIGQYLSHSSAGSLYGAAGSLVIVLLWIYYSSMIVLLGAEFTQVWARSYGKKIEPAPGAVAAD